MDSVLQMLPLFFLNFALFYILDSITTECSNSNFRSMLGQSLLGHEGIHGLNQDEVKEKCDMGSCWAVVLPYY